jgi:prepilin-type N-terminal cleavage/methylation domain-containing protein
VGGITVLDRLRTKQANDEGFTLIEMLIVIVVLGVLAGITVFGVSTFKKDSEDSACQASGKTVGVAADAFAAKTGNYPTSIATDLVGNSYLKTAPTGGTFDLVPAVTGVPAHVKATCTSGKVYDNL